jgi:uncharacterized 2Fe-2S/4Fe-4S cluster protein (DUF4445 family)
MKKREIIVTFEPYKLSVRAEPRTTIFQAASKAGLYVRSECGGRGKCGKCKIIPQNNDAVTEVTPNEIEHLSPNEIDLGYRLACCTMPKQSLVVMIPEESRSGARSIQIAGLERYVHLNPSIRKIHMKLPKPTLSDARPDFERIVDGLRAQNNPERLEISIELLRELPNILRDANWDITVTLWNKYKIIAVEPGDTTDSLAGLAIDVGTSKIVVYVVDLITGKTVGIGSIENPQVTYGEDVISRIYFATIDDKNLRTLRRAVVKGINDALCIACTEAHISWRNVYQANFVGNTAMHHFLLGVQPKYTALSPFTPALKKSLDIKAEELKLEINPGGIVHVLPIIAGFVGSDVVMDILASGIYESKEISLLLDIGTNTEVLVGNKEDILCCSCASGPAFEGSHIEHGMIASTGAIEKVHIFQNSFEVECETIGHVKPVGLCGSAMIDVVAEMFKSGVIDNMGRLNLQIETRRLVTTDDNIEFVISEEKENSIGKDITVTQNDIYEVLLAKAAIFTGCSILMKRKGLRKEDLDHVFVAGAFGNYISTENAKCLGLLPDVPTEKIKFIGNTAITGAKMTLTSREARETAERLSKKVRYTELATDPEFNLEFINALLIPHKDLKRFQSVKQYWNRQRFKRALN